MKIASEMTSEVSGHHRTIHGNTKAWTTHLLWALLAPHMSFNRWIVEQFKKSKGRSEDLEDALNNEPVFSDC